MIEVNGLYKNFGSKKVLVDVNLSLSRGGVYGIVGKNGAGKTTLFRCIAGLEKFKGEIRSDLEPLRNHLGFLPTEPFFFSKITGAEYLRLLCKARSVASDAVEEKNIFDLPLKEYASTYSTGMKKKLALTALLLQENSYFILDEPFNGVDIQSNIILVDVIRKLKELNKIVVISSHIFSTLGDTCNEIHLLTEGRLSKTVQKEEFKKLEEEMRSVSIGDRIERLNLR